jgi:hypothetical protein
MDLAADTRACGLRRGKYPVAELNVRGTVESACVQEVEAGWRAEQAHTLPEHGRRDHEVHFVDESLRMVDSSRSQCEVLAFLSWAPTP